MIWQVKKWLLIYYCTSGKGCKFHALDPYCKSSKQLAQVKSKESSRNSRFIFGINFATFSNYGLSIWTTITKLKNTHKIVPRVVVIIKKKFFITANLLMSDILIPLLWPFQHRKMTSCDTATGMKPCQHGSNVSDDNKNLEHEKIQRLDPSPAVWEQQWPHGVSIFLCTQFLLLPLPLLLLPWSYGVTIPYTWHRSGAVVVAWKMNGSGKNRAAETWMPCVATSTSKLHKTESLIQSGHHIFHRHYFCSHHHQHSCVEFFKF